MIKKTIRMSDHDDSNDSDDDDDDDMPAVIFQSLFHNFSMLYH